MASGGPGRSTWGSRSPRRPDREPGFRFSREGSGFAPGVTGLAGSAGPVDGR